MKTIVVILAFFVLGDLMAADCLLNFDQLISKYELNPTKDQIENYKVNGQKLIDEIREERLKLHASLPGLPNECKIKLKEVFLQMRTMEDYIGAHFYKGPQVSADTIDYKKIAPPVKFEFQNHPGQCGSLSLYSSGSSGIHCKDQRNSQCW